MNTKNLKKAKIIFVIYLIATLALLFLGYSVQKPKVAQQEFPFTITYSYQGETKTISDVYIGEYVRSAKYLGDDSLAWYGYIKDHNRLESDFYRIGEINGQAFSINLNLEPGYLMGDPKYAGSVCQPTGVCHSFDGTNDITVTDPAELEMLGFSIVNWEYPKPIENAFSFGGISLSSEATMYTAIIAIAALLSCMILIKKDKELVYGKLDKVSIVLNVLIAIVAFPFIFIVSALSEIVADASVWQQILYFTPALTVLGIGASVALRRLGCKRTGFGIQFAGPLIFALLILIVNP
jgi:hypothetical protein